jgi:hypothetical protein
VNKDLKMLLISLGLLIGTVVYMYVSQHYRCSTIEYQDLSGTHSMDVCEWVNK